MFYSAEVLAGFSENMSSINYKINTDSVNIGGGDSQNSTNYKNKDTIGEIATSNSDVTNYKLKAGYRQTSDVSVTTTPTPTPIPSDTGGPGETKHIIPPIISNIIVADITFNSAKVLWDTDEQALCKFYLGESADYEIGIFSEISFFFKHSEGLTNLLEGTIYHFKIFCMDTNRNESETSDWVFETLISPMPQNVNNLRTEPGDKQITLIWENPKELDFEGVRIVRNDKFYPSNPQDGVIIYEGQNNSFVDINLENRKRYYYAVFSYNKAGIFSSGAIVSETPRAPGEVAPPPPEIVPVEPPPAEIEKITINDFDFFLQKEKLSVLEGKIQASAEKPLTVFLNYAKVPEILKTIMVTLKKGNEYFSFILRVNKEKTGFEATILSPVEPGIYPLAITILDYKNQALKRITGELKVEGNKILTKKFSWKDGLPYIYILLAIIIILYLLVRLRERRKKEETYNNTKFQILNSNDPSFVPLISGTTEGKKNSNFKTDNNKNIIPEELKTPQLSPPEKEQNEIKEQQKMTDLEGRERKDFPDFRP